MAKRIRVKLPMQDEFDQLLSARRRLSQSLCGLQARQRELTHAATVLAPSVEALQVQLKVIDSQISCLTKAPRTHRCERVVESAGLGCCSYTVGTEHITVAHNISGVDR
jgi:hypothetical protein